MNEKKLPELFIGCSTEILSAAKALQNNLQNITQSTIWTQDTFRPSRVTIHEIIRSAQDADFAVFILAPDDFLKYRHEEQKSPRDNTIFEAGLFMGILGIERVFLLKPRDITIKLPTDLMGITTIMYDIPSENRWEAALGPAANKIEKEIKEQCSFKKNNNTKISNPGPHQIYSSLGSANEDIRKYCIESVDIKIFANKGIVFIGTDDSLISTAEIKNYTNLKKLRVILLSPESRWLTRGFLALRKDESMKSYIEELNANHQIVEHGFHEFSKILSSSRSGIKYHKGEPYWRFVITDKAAFVSSYADEPKLQIRDLPVARYDNIPRSFYKAFDRYFNDVWHNQSYPGKEMTTQFDLSVSAGGLVYIQIADSIYILLLQRSEGLWVLPKGHKKISDKSLEDAALREVSEECGLSSDLFEIEKELDSYVDDSFIHENEKKIVHIYLMKLKNSSLPVLMPDFDHIKAAWWSIEEPLPEMFYSSQIRLVSEFKDFFKGGKK